RRNRGGLVIDVQVEYHTRVLLTGPRQSALSLRLDQADRAVDDVGRVMEQVAPDIVHEDRETIARYIELSDHLPDVGTGPQPLVKGRVITLEVAIELMGVAPI